MPLNDKFGRPLYRNVSKAIGNKKYKRQRRELNFFWSTCDLR